ncbi:MAG: 1-(5-phosphoribosyl)-5-[(5-phosphoribosylamino)methylideneamino]imidazole-4-carboxamide isomerase [Chromatiales bacterium]|nr:1-(5-phosphoribosyl)-5-[(5-phosphoribosylamino)methylideneamino]imidazole-4-carboxamide isomerase [Chromatiales bacterium]
MEVIPAIDLLGGKCVRLYKGDFGAVSEYDEDPLQLAARYRSAGLSRLHVVDLDGARTGSPGNAAIIGELTRKAGMQVQVGGGVRSLDSARALLDSGASRVVVGSVAAEAPDEVLGWIEPLGAGRLILAFDIRTSPGEDPEVVTRGWTQGSGRSLWSLVERFADAGPVEFLCTDVACDGTLEGPNLALYEDCCRRFPASRFIASGGVSGVADLPALAATGVSGVVTGKALLDGRLTLEEAGRFSRDA